MVAASLSLEADLEFAVTYRNLPELHTEREVTSKARFQTETRFSRHGKRQGPVHSAHRRSVKVNCGRCA